MRQQKFKRGKERMLSIAQESGDGQTLIQPEEEEEDDDGMTAVGVEVKCVLMVLKADG